MFTHHLIAEALVRQHQHDLARDARSDCGTWLSDEPRARRWYNLRS